MSWGLKLLASFPALGAGATYSFVAASGNKDKEIPLQEVPIQEIAPAPVTKVEEVKPPEPVPEPAPSVQEVIKEVMQEKKYLGCGFLGGFRDRKTFWYICASQDGLDKPTLYNYDRSKPADSRNKQVISLSSKSKTVRFTKGVTESLKYPPFWMSRFGGKDLEPEKHCKLEKNGKGSSSYDLRCHGQVIPNSIDF